LETKERAAIYKLHAEYCKTLADANRLLIINVLSKGELPVNEIARQLGLQQSNVSKHLSLMREHGLVNTRRDGSTIFYALADYRIFEAIRLLKEAQADQIENRRKLAQGEPTSKVEN
jgi:DNA-binding transcriptional ArsR family regulator